MLERMGQCYGLYTTTTTTNVHLSCAYQRPERSHNTYSGVYDRDDYYMNGGECYMTRGECYVIQVSVIWSR